MAQLHGRETKNKQKNPAVAAALIGGAAAAATAGAIWSARAIARRNGAHDGRDLNPVMKTAVTACELAHRPGGCDEPEAPVGERPKPQLVAH